MVEWATELAQGGQTEVHAETISECCPLLLGGGGGRHVGVWEVDLCTMAQTVTRLT